MATRLGRRGRARGDLISRGHRGDGGTRAARSAWSLFWRFHPRGVDVASRRTLEDAVEARRHPLGVIAVLIIITIIVAGGLFLRLPPLPGFRSTRLQCLAVEVFLFLPFLLRVLAGLQLLGGLAPRVTVDLVLLYWRPRGPDINPSLPEQRWT